MSTPTGIPTGAGFAIGTSSTLAAATAASRVDMSLDDLIKNRRKEEQQKRESVKKPTSTDKAVGKGRAKRSATIAARRGIAATEKPSAMQVEKETYRQQRKRTGGRGNPAGPKGKQEEGGRRSRRVANARAKSEADIKAKKKAQQQPKKTTGNSSQQQNPRPPTKKALNAAVGAMADAGFKVPKGMQMVISFAPAPAPANKKQGGGGRGGENRNTNRGRGRGGRGRGGRR